MSVQCICVCVHECMHACMCEYAHAAHTHLVGGGREGGREGERRSCKVNSIIQLSCFLIGSHSTVLVSVLATLECPGFQ